MIGLVLVGYATNGLSYILFGFLTDSYGPYAASAYSALSLLRTLMAAILPPFTYNMYAGLGGNVATRIFAAVTAILWRTSVVFIRYGRKLRGMSRFAQADVDGGDDRDEETCSRVEEVFLLLCRCGFQGRCFLFDRVSLLLSLQWPPSYPRK